MKLIQNLPKDTNALYAEASVFALLGELFNRNPDAQLIESVRALENDALGGSTELAALFGRLRSYAALSGLTEDDEAFLNLKRDWTKLFRGISPTYGPKAPYGLLYDKCQTPALMADLAALYLDGGFDGFQDVHDRIDYIGTGFKYLAAVALQQIYAVQQKNYTDFARLALCRVRFARDFFSWVPEFTEGARAYAQTDFYKAVLDLADFAVNEYLSREEPTAGAEVPQTVSAVLN
jgi:TorA maturation chaperone TorD